MNRPTAKYKIADTFKITDRGLVFAGAILDGTIYIGDFIEFEAFEKIRVRQIIGIEGMTKANPDRVNTGLLIKCIDETEIDELRNWTPENCVGLILKKES